jgi:hypothetical protein
MSHMSSIGRRLAADARRKERMRQSPEVKPLEVGDLVTVGPVSRAAPAGDLRQRVLTATEERDGFEGTGVLEARDWTFGRVRLDDGRVVSVRLSRLTRTNRREP